MVLVKLRSFFFNLLVGFLKFVWFICKPIRGMFPSLTIVVSDAIQRSPILNTLLVGNISRVNYADFEESSNEQEILIDITHVYKNDLKTGIQRVVRSVLAGLKLAGVGAVEPVYLTDECGFWHYRYVNRPDALMVVPKRGDRFIGLDLNSNIIAAEAAGLFCDWKNRETGLAFVVYDILPLEHPEWWGGDVSVGHELWLRTVLRLSDDIVCISKSVLDSVKLWANKAGCARKKSPNIHWFHLGADLEYSMPTQGLPNDAQMIIDYLKQVPTFLMVGTIEPRKGYTQALDAFETLWSDGYSVNLVIVGKNGWLVDELIERICTHAELGKHLFWLESISDEYLLKIYEASNCLLAASEGEGFGLPLIEAAQHNVPIIARDIPVFREVAQQYAFYFYNSNDPQVIVDVIVQWLDLNSRGEVPLSGNMPWLTWRESAEQLSRALGLKGNPRITL